MNKKVKKSIQNSDQENNHFHMADLVIDIIPKLMQLLRVEMRKGRGDYLTVPQFRVLASISRGINQNKLLAERLGVSEAAMSRMIDVLVNENLIKKGIDADDRRHMKLSLTSEGNKIFKAIKGEARLRLKDKVGAISNHDVELIIVGLETLQKNISALNMTNMPE